MKKKTIDDLLKEYDVSQEWLEEHYGRLKWSLPDIRRTKRLGFKTTCRLLRHFGIPIRGSSESASLQHVREKYSQTCEERYGVNNVSKNDSIKKKKAQTFIENYGVDNIWKLKSYYAWLDSYMVSKYGSKRTGVAIWETEQHSKQAIKRWANFSPEKREELIKKIIDNLHKVSSSKDNRIETRISQLLDELQFTYTRRVRHGRYVFDFVLSDFNVAIETNGDFWHANPLIYKEDDVLKFPGTKGLMAKDIWEKDKRKLDYAKKNGYSLITIWETEIKSDKAFQILWERIQNALKSDKKG